MRWFKFGVVRGILGILVGGILLLGATASMPPQQYTQQSINQMLLGTGGQLNLITTWCTVAPLAAIIGLIASGVIYWLGAEVAKYSGLNTTGFWSAATAGVLGSFILITITVVLLGAVHSSTPSVWPQPSVNIIPVLIASIPAALITEVGYAAVAWKLYEILGWKTPA